MYNVPQWGWMVSMHRKRNSHRAKQRLPEESLSLCAGKLVEALMELRDLLEEYAPVWYTEEHREKVMSALRMAEQARRRAA
jgi:hypothetical protein